MKIVADENIVFVPEFFSQTGGADHQLVLKAGRNISQADLVDADALLVRSVTQVNADLLDNTAVKFVGTATIGTDHIDQDFLAKNGITFADAAGCSTDTVAQYVITAIHALRPHYLHERNQLVITLGIVGYGNIGKTLAQIAKQLGWPCLVYDPFVDVRQDDLIQPASFDEVLSSSNIISLHVPLTYAGQSDYPTHHLINADSLAKIPADTLLINSARGKVVCEADLLDDIARTNRQVVLDVFEHEPQLSHALVNALALATPHIAGYSLEGKARGTQFIYDAFCAWQGVHPTVNFDALLPKETDYFSVLHDMSLNQRLSRQLTEIYNIKTDDDDLRNSVLTCQNTRQMNQFDALRKQYLLRREWQAYGLKLTG